MNSGPVTAWLWSRLMGVTISGDRLAPTGATPGMPIRIDDNHSLCRNTQPAAQNNQGDFARFCLDDITQGAPGGSISFRYIAYRSVFAADHPGARIRVNGSSLDRVEQFFTPGTPITLGVDSVQLDESSRSGFNFLSWTDGGIGRHTVTASEVPDTIIARVAVDYRLRMTVQGAPTAAITTVARGPQAPGCF